MPPIDQRNNMAITDEDDSETILVGPSDMMLIGTRRCWDAGMSEMRNEPAAGKPYNRAVRVSLDLCCI